jgi:amino acid transporter
MATSASVLKRVLVGRQVATSRLEHTLLPKILALPVFSSDPMSSVAYATEEILLVLVAASLSSRTLVMPIAVAIAILMTLVVISYRQTVRAYPSGGGAYIVSKENLGTLPALVAAAALLTDYVLTVSVSVAAGVFAITSAAPELGDLRVEMSLGFVTLITLANLRGVRESGTLFAIPTYAFIVCIVLMILSGLYQCLGGCPQVSPPEHPAAIGTAASVGLFTILHAFSSGSTALTGVEAISNGVPAFRRPQARNAAATLAVMGVIAVTLFLGISFMALRTGVLPSHEQSVVSQIARAVFSEGFGFYAVQVTTAAILVLAANTAYQDFPRLSAILARDRFMPRQFENRGDRLVFSNGIVVLAVLAFLLIWAFDADVSRLIQLYVVGVFTSFTLSQTGMVRHWLRAREPGWRRSIVINAVGAAATGVVLVVIAATKFVHGAWIVIGAIPIIVLLLRGVQRHYSFVEGQLRAGRVRFGEPGRNRVVLVITEFNAAAAQALGYVRSLRPAELHPVYVGSRLDTEVEVLWDGLSRTGPPIRALQGRDRTDAVLDFVRAVPREPSDFVTVVIPELFHKASLLHAVTRRTTFELKVRLLSEPQVAVTDVPVVLQDGDLVGVGDARPLVPQRVEALVFVGGVHDGTIRAVNYARSLHASEIRAVYVALEPGEDLDEILGRWTDSGADVPLEIVEAPFRDLGPPVIDEVRRITSDPNAVAAVVLPEYLVARWWQRLLHNNRALFIKRRLLFEPRVILSSVPYPLEAREQVSVGSEVQ